MTDLKLAAQKALLPCPFCGSEPWGIFGPHQDLGQWWVECHGPDENTNCGDWYHSTESDDPVAARAEVAAAWNQRSALQHQEEREPDDGPSEMLHYCDRNIEVWCRKGDAEMVRWWTNWRAEVVKREAGNEKDAARYQWLRGGSCVRQGEVVLNRGSRVIDKNQHTALVAFHFWCGPEELDAAIDAAMLAGRASIEGVGK